MLLSGNGHDTVLWSHREEQAEELRRTREHKAKLPGVRLPEGITIEASRESSFKSGRIDYRAMAVADCKPIVEEAFIKLTRSAT